MIWQLELLEDLWLEVVSKIGSQCEVAQRQFRLLPHWGFTIVQQRLI